ncbi:unnamed protein product [Symbiodinium sp. KB8]|nr:unnamed protein product [Symbiodinium sp. KB8]
MHGLESPRQAGFNDIDPTSVPDAEYRARREYLRVVTGEVERGAGVEANLGKTRVYNAAGGDAPPGIAALGPDVWCGDLPPARRGFVALGVPIGHPDFVGAHAAGRLEAEADLLHKLQRLPDLQSGFGLLSAERVSFAAYWAAWADALPVLRARYPEVADGLVHELDGEPAQPCLRAAALAAHRLAEAGWEARPDWDACARGAGRPAVDGELGLGNPGWQRHAVLALHTSFRERVLLPTLTPAARAVLHSQSGPHAGMWLAAIPSDAASTLTPDLMHVALRRRLPLPLTGRRSKSTPTATTTSPALAQACCHGVASLSSDVERAWAQVAREAVGPEGRVVPQQWLAHTTAPQVRTDDRRRLDFVVYGATTTGEALCCDATLVSPLTRAGRPIHGAHARAGVALDAARRRKVARYPELTRGGPQRLVVLAAEVGGRWNDE